MEEDLSPHVSVRENGRPDAEITDSYEREIEGAYLDLPYGGTIRIEYKPAEYILAEDGWFKELLREASQYVEAEGLSREDFITDLYLALVSQLYPKSAYLEKPWQELPLVVSLRMPAEEAREDDSWVDESHISLGNFR